MKPKRARLVEVRASFILDRMDRNGVQVAFERMCSVLSEYGTDFILPFASR